MATFDTIDFATAGTTLNVATAGAGWTSSEREIVGKARTLAGPSGVGHVILFAKITKTGGGTINAATESLRIEASQTGASGTWRPVRDAFGDTSPANFFTGGAGTSSIELAQPVLAYPFMRVKLTGDNVDDAYTINQLSLSVP